MKKLPLVFLMMLFFAFAAHAQTDSVKTKKHANKSSIVRDSAGMVYPYVVWRKMVSSGDYGLKAIDPNNDHSEYIIRKRDSAQIEKRLARMPKPTESSFFTDGEKISSFTAHDIDGNKLKLKDLEGKIVVLNFWFIGCPPCRKEIPELNKMAMGYANDPNVVFIAVGLDMKGDIKQFIKTSPLAYHIVDDGRSYADEYGIHLFPTNVVLDKDGKVKFHSVGYAKNTPYWIKKTIEELK
jgi:thiol-disulfide isomerase/thioredoxin